MCGGWEGATQSHNTYNKITNGSYYNKQPTIWLVESIHSIMELLYYKSTPISHGYLDYR